MSEAENRKGTREFATQDRLPDRRKILSTGMLRGAVDYVPLPEPSKRRTALKHPWRIALVHAGNPATDVIGVEIHADVVLGRAAASEKAPDLDLSIYDAVEHGVSRRHAMLRPTDHQLFLMDVGSTNGTRVNGVSQGARMARALKHNDTVSLGNLHLIIKIMVRPGDLRPD